MEVFSYRTINAPATGEFKEKGSKFLAFVYSVTSEPEIKERIADLKKKYFDARHHCYAYILGPDKAKFRANDDGEPNHSAGDPILGQIRSKNLTNVLVVVIRYFGGVKLGVGGLIAAYKSAAEEALNNATVIEKEIAELFTLEYGYASTPEVMRLVKEFELLITEQKFEENCIWDVEVALRNKKRFFDKLALINALGNQIRITQK
jgi:uncharacterized YigZ family protein